MVLSSEERQEGLDEFHRGYDKNILDENLREEKTQVMATLSEYFNREMIFADERLIKGNETVAAVYSHIAKLIDTALRTRNKISIVITCYLSQFPNYLTRHLSALQRCFTRISNYDKSHYT
jgi:hypothetical protein